MRSDEIRSRFLKFFEKRGHKIIPSSSLIPGDPTVLFTTAGMQQFKSYYTAPDNALHDFDSKNTTSSQKCIRTVDIDEVGDATHLTFFEMLGNFSFGGYGRSEAITYAYEFITQELGLDISYVTFYKGEGVVPRDEESKDIWTNLGVSDIREDGSDVFWGPTGDSGPCGPTTEIYCKNAEGADVEIWNIVFNEYFCEGSRLQLDKGEAKLKKLDILGVDTGMGLERLSATVQKKKNVYETDLFNNEETKEERIVADHVKASLFMISDGVVPANTGRGYIVRRLIRRAIRFSKKPLALQIEKVKKLYQGIYDLDDKGEIEKEEDHFRKTLEIGLKEFEKGVDPFILFTTYGFPIELTLELAKEKGKNIDLEDFNKKMTEHQKLSQTSSAGMFKGGLANHNEKTIKLHTAHHLLLAGLQHVVDKNIKQRGSNITEERLRIDFLCDHKLTDEEKKKTEDWVNERINEDLKIVRKEMPLKEAEKLGAEMEFGAKYPEKVSVYFIEDKDGTPISKEFCGGPHVENTGELGTFKILKEEAVAQGIRRIKATLS
ncbi:MAG: alanine--tRNA ligase-related protein [Candidatus Parcubacteria bacterium]|nr:alanine--tRNA ligase-related protein [Candidatus Parcubacteria bacterium]